MVNAQQWLNKNYPEQLRSEIYEIYLNEQLEGTLDLSKFSVLLTIYISCHLNENELGISNQNEEAEIVKLVDAQTWLDQNYPKNGVCQRETNDTHWLGDSEGWNNKNKKRSEITKLDIGRQNLEGNLELSGFVNLKFLECGANCLTSLNLNDCVNLEELLCFENQLTSLDVSNLGQLKTIIFQNNNLTNVNYPTSNPEKLIHLSVGNNNLAEQGIAVFGKFFNLKRLFIGSNFKKREIQGVYNRFTGSLKDLSNLKNLELLDFDATDIDSGLEYLTDSLQKISCTGKLAAQLKNYQIKNEDDSSTEWYDYQSWKKTNLALINQIHNNEKSILILQPIQSALARGKSTSEPLSQIERVFDALIFYLEEEIRSIKKELYQERKLEATVELPSK